MLLLGLYQQTLNSELKQLELIEVNFLRWWSEYEILVLACRHVILNR